MAQCPVCGDEFDSNQARGAHLVRHDEKHIKDALTDEMEKVQSNIGRTPRGEDITEFSSYGKSIFTSTFGSHTEALIASGMEPNQSKSICNRESLLEELERIAREHGEPVTSSKVDEYGIFSRTTYKNYFKSLRHAISEAGLETSDRHITRNELIDEINRLHDELDRVPTSDDIRSNSMYSLQPFVSEFGTYSNALRKSGYEPQFDYWTDKEDIIEDIKEQKEKDGQLTYREFDSQVDYSISKVVSTFGSWNEARIAAGLDPIQEKDISRERLLSEIERVYEKTGSIPTTTNIKEISAMSTQPFMTEFGNWSNALREAGFDIPDREYVETKWNVDDIDNYYGESWEDSRQEVIERDGGICRVCDSSNRPSVHHIKPRRMFENPDDSNTLDNLITLCPSCHATFEGMWKDCNHKEFEERAKNVHR